MRSSIAGRWIGAIVIAVVAASLVACDRPGSTGAGSAAPAASGAAAPTAARVLRRGNGSEVDSLDPALAVLTESGNVLRDAYEGLTALDEALRPVPAAAERWDVSADGRVYTFHLRPSARWSNGDPVTAEDFVASWRRLVDPKTGSQYAKILENVVGAAEITAGKASTTELGVDAAGTTTLVVRLVRPTAYFPALVSHWSTLPTWRGQPPGKAPAIVSNGAFTIAEYVPGAVTVLRRNPRYWNARATHLDEVRFLQVANPEDEFKRYRAGELDLTSTLPLQPLDEIRGAFGDQLRVVPLLGLYYYGFNTAKPPFDSRELRQALSMTLDRERLVDGVLRLGNPPAYSLVPDGLPQYTPQKPTWAAWPYARRVEKARELYAKAGYSVARPLRFELRYNTGTGHERLALAAAAMWKDTLGVETKLVPQEFKSMLPAIQNGDVQMFRSSWVADYPDAYTFLQAYAEGSSMNLSRYRNANFQRDLATSVNEADPVKRRALLEASERQFVEDAPIIPVYFMVNRRLVSPRVSGWRDNAMRTNYSSSIRIAQ